MLLEIIATEHDIVGLMRHLFSLDVSVIPSHFYETNNYTTIASLPHFIDDRQIWHIGEYYCVRSDFQKHDLVMSPIHRDNEVFFTLWPRYGGPYLSLQLPPASSSGTIGGGSISLYRTYRIFREGCPDPSKAEAKGEFVDITPPVTLVTLFNNCRRFIKNNSTKATTATNRIFWVCKDAAEQIEAGRRKPIYDLHFC